MRHTSKVAYTALKESGQLGRLQTLALELLRAHGPMTSRQLCEVAGEEGLWKRLSELEANGYIRAKGEVTCTRTHRTVTIWEAVDPSGSQLDMFGCGAV